MSRPQYVFWGTCPDVTYEFASHVTKEMEELSYGWFRQHVSRAELLRNPWGIEALYRISCEDNWSIAFYRSTFPDGTTCFVMQWSAYEIYFAPTTYDILPTK